MALSVTVYKFPKKINSTKLPEIGTPQYTFDMTLLKDSCDMFAPTLQWNQGLTSFPFVPNYVYIPLFERYYFINSVTWKDGIWTFQCVVDVLASFKTQIGQQSLYVLRSASSYDTKILDTTYIATSQTTFDINQLSSPWETTDLESGKYIVGVAGQSTTYYVFSYAALDLFLGYLFSDAYADDVVSGWATAFPELKAMLNPLQFITSILWIPHPLTGFGTSVSTIRVGWADVGVVAKKVDGAGLVFFGGAFTPVRHPQAVTRGEYLNNAPYSDYTLFYPPFGKLQIDPNEVANNMEIGTLVNLDLRTGEGTLTVFDDEGVIISWVHSQVGINYQVSQVVNRSGFGLGQMAGMAGSAVGLGASLATGNLAGGIGAVSGISSGLGDFAQSKVPSANTIGSNGGMNALRGLPTLQSEFKTIVDEDITHRGRPLCKVRTINTLSGFIQVDKADVSISTASGEQEQIRSYMEGGFYYE